MSKAKFGIFNVPVDDERVVLPSVRPFPWSAVWSALIVISFVLGWRTGVALIHPVNEILTGRISLQCGVDGHAELDVSNEQIDGDHVLEALRHAAGRICSRHGT